MPKRPAAEIPVDINARLFTLPDAKSWEQPLDGDSIVSVLINSSYTAVSVVGKADAIIGEPQRVLLCAELTGRPNLASWPMLSGFKIQYPGEPYIALHVTAKNRRRGEYHLNDHNYAEWIDAVDTCAGG